jgi:hypothetical protein
VPDKKEGWFDAGALQHSMQLDGDIAGRSRAAAWAAPAQTSTIVRCGMGEVGDHFLYVTPVQIGGSDPRFKEHGRAARSLFKQIELARNPDIDPPPEAGISPSITARTNPLIEKPGNDQRCGKT